MPRTKAVPGTKSKQLNVYLLLRSVQQFSDALKSPASWPNALALNIGADEGMLYGKAKSSGKPDWVHMLEAGLVPPQTSPFQSVGGYRASALYILKVRGRFFALTFGSGNSFLKADCWESRFGLRIALNLADQANLQQAAFKSHQGRTFTREVSASRLSGFYDFGFDGERDFVKKITAKLKAHALGVRITGKDSVAIVCPASLTDLPKKCSELYRLFRSDKYTQSFPDVDKVIPITAKAKVAQLESELENQLAVSNNPLVHFAYPDLIDYDRYSGMRVGTSSIVVDDLDLSTLESELQASPLTVAKLQERSSIVALVDDNDMSYGEKSLYLCCIAEISVGGESFLLSEGSWHRLDHDYVTGLNNYIDSIPSSNVLSGVPRNKETSENAYLMKLKPLQGHGFVVAHKEMVMHGGGQSKLEVCDLLRVPPPGTKWELVHVKGGGGGAEFGHLVNQAFSSAEALTDPDSRFGQDALHKLTPQFQVNGITLPAAFPVEAREYVVVFALFGENSVSASASTTLFGKIAFRRVAKSLKRYGFEIRLIVMPP